jgi:hypothetical protein
MNAGDALVVAPQAIEGRSQASEHRDDRRGAQGASPYERLGGYAIAAVVDNFIDRVTLVIFQEREPCRSRSRTC